jgi:Zn-dependent protease with chaperone function
MPRPFDSNAYRVSNEHITLAITLLLIGVIIFLTATATVCVSIFFVIGIVILSYIYSRSQHQALLARAQQVTLETAPTLFEIVRAAQSRLQVEPVQVFIVPNKTLNAYTFGMDSPKAIVLHSALFQVMDEEELQFIIGHELGHVDLGHTWLNTLVGGMAGIPSSVGAAAILELAFRWWNRACEYSADRAGMLACNNPAKCISALVKLEAGVNARSQGDLISTIQRIEAEDDDLANNLNELLATHPMIIKRIAQIRSYARSPEYARLQSLMNQNLV